MELTQTDWADSETYLSAFETFTWSFQRPWCIAARAAKRI